MALFHSNLGIDFRQNHLILTFLRKSLNRIRLVDYRIYPLWSEGQKEVQQAQWISLITSFISKHQVNKERVAVSIPREKAVVRFLRLPTATKENLRKVLEYEAPKYTPFDKDEVYFDYQVLKEEKDWVHLIAVFVRKSELESYLALLRRIGIRPDYVQIPSAAALNLFFYHQGERGAENAVLLDLSNPFCEMNLVQGRDWKESFHLALPAEKREERILQVLKQAGVNGAAIDKMSFFVYGLDAAEGTLPELGQGEALQNFAPPPLSRIEVGKNEAKPDYIYASIGLPLQGLARTRVGLNLLPQEMRRKVRQIAKPLFSLLVVLALLLAGTWGVGIYRYYRNDLDRLRAEVKKRKPEVEAVEKLQKRRGELVREITELEKIRSGEARKIDILKEFTQVLPPTVWIWNLKCSGRDVEISGFADSASELIPILDKSPLFEKVEFSSPVTKERERKGTTERERERFKIKMKLESRRPGP
jgi:general secretion pathway protein L